MFEIYRAVMDSDRNPLNNLPRAQRFQIMVVLSSMWTTIFCTAAGAWFWYGELLFAHVLVALGVALTGQRSTRPRSGPLIAAIQRRMERRGMMMSGGRDETLARWFLCWQGARC